MIFDMTPAALPSIMLRELSVLPSFP